MLSRWAGDAPCSLPRRLDVRWIPGANVHDRVAAVQDPLDTALGPVEQSGVGTHGASDPRMLDEWLADPAGGQVSVY
ncbi:hypothetical protein GCM10010431_84650 [Streptomyces kunmingensis]